MCSSEKCDFPTNRSKTIFWTLIIQVIIFFLTAAFFLIAAWGLRFFIEGVSLLTKNSSAPGNSFLTSLSCQDCFWCITNNAFVCTTNKPMVVSICDTFKFKPLGTIIISIVFIIGESSTKLCYWLLSMSQWEPRLFSSYIFAPLFGNFFKLHEFPYSRILTYCHPLK
jgi:hypothetical protein